LIDLATDIWPHARLSDITKSDFAYWYRCYRSVVCLSVTFVHCAQTAKDIDTYDSSMSLPDRFEIWLTSVNLSLHKFYPKVTQPQLTERRRHSMANCGRMVRDSATVTMDSI